MTDHEVLIRLPWPARRQSPNAGQQGAWRAKSEAAKAYKHICGWECKRQAVRSMGCDSVSVEVTFSAPTARSYDLDNALASIKQGLDAVADAIGVDDANWSEMRLVRGDKIKGGSVLVHIKPNGGSK